MNYEKIYQKLNEETPVSLMKYINDISIILVATTRNIDNSSFYSKLKKRAEVGDDYFNKGLDSISITKDEFLKRCLKEYANGKDTRYIGLKNYIGNNDYAIVLTNIINNYIFNRKNGWK